jgi:hypothetical protein
VLPKLGVGSVLRCKVDEISEGYILLKPKQDTFSDYDLSEFGDFDPMEISIVILKKDLGATRYQPQNDAKVVVLSIDHTVPELTCRPATKEERQK